MAAKNVDIPKWLLYAYYLACCIFWLSYAFLFITIASHSGGWHLWLFILLPLSRLLHIWIGAEKSADKADKK